MPEKCDIIWFAKCFCFSPDSVSTITRRYEWHNRRLSVIPLHFTDGSNQQDLDISKVGVRVMDELVEPLKKIKIDDTEFACLKAIVFFDPSKCVSVNKSENGVRIEKKLSLPAIQRKCIPLLVRVAHINSILLRQSRLASSPSFLK